MADLVAPLGPAGLAIDMTRLPGLAFATQAVSLAAQGNPLRSSSAWSVRLP